MAFAAPFWLLGLVPWAAMTVWLLWGKRRPMVVPFLPLWQGEPGRRVRRRALAVPPLALAAIILAMALAIVAAAGPVVRKSNNGSVITVIVDRGASMSAFGASGQPRYVDVARELDGRFRNLGRGLSRVEMVDLVTRKREAHGAGDWVSAVASMPRTGIDTGAAITPAVRDELARGTGPVILLSDQGAGIEDARFAELSPASVVRNVGFTRVAARESPSAQMMVAVRNDAGLAKAELRVSMGGQQVTRTIDLPAAGMEARYFIDVPKLGDIVEATLGVSDECDVDNVAWLVRSSPPRIEVQGAVSDPVWRVVGVYNRVKPGDAKAGAVVVVSRREDLLAADEGVIVEPPGATAAAGELHVASHPLTALVDWSAAVRDAMAAAPPQGEQWTPLVAIGGRALVAARASPARQVWVGFDAPQWARSADFVVFWTNVLDWVRGDREASFNAEAVRLLAGAKRVGNAPAAPNVDERAWPGIYELPGGQRVAMNAMGLRFVQRPGSLDAGRVLASAEVAQEDLSPWVLLAAIGCAVVAARFCAPAVASASIA